jgi:hypothetical protein
MKYEARITWPRGATWGPRTEVGSSARRRDGGTSAPPGAEQRRAESGEASGLFLARDLRI